RALGLPPPAAAPPPRGATPAAVPRTRPRAAPPRVPRLIVPPRQRPCCQRPSRSLHEIPPRCRRLFVHRSFPLSQCLALNFSAFARSKSLIIAALRTTCSVLTHQY